jgi:hypothetical protein
VLGLVGMNGLARWLGWIDFGVGVVAFAMAALVPRRKLDAIRWSSFAVGLACLGLWVVGLAENAPWWQAWWTFALGIGFLLVAAVPAWATRSPMPWD